MVDFGVQLIGLIQGAPSIKNGMGNFEDANIDLGIRRGKSADKLLNIEVSMRSSKPCSLGRPYLGERIPPPPEVRVGNDADSFSELLLNIWGAGNHQANKALFYYLHLVLRNLVASFLVLGAA